MNGEPRLLKRDTARPAPGKAGVDPGGAIGQWQQRRGN